MNIIYNKFCRAEINIKPWRSVMKDIKEGNKKSKWKDRVPMAYWKGNPHVTPNRADLLKCNLTQQHNWNTLLYVQVHLYIHTCIQSPSLICIGSSISHRCKV